MRVAVADMARGRNLLWALVAVASVQTTVATAGTWTLVGWNNLGMHCMDADFSVFSLLPPYNTIHAQLIDPQGQLVREPRRVSPSPTRRSPIPDGSINTTSAGKTNFWEHVLALFGVALPVDVGPGRAAHARRAATSRSR